MMWSGRTTLPQPSGRAVRGFQAVRSAGGPLQPQSAAFISGPVGFSLAFLPSFIPTHAAHRFRQPYPPRLPPPRLPSPARRRPWARGQPRARGQPPPRRDRVAQRLHRAILPPCRSTPRRSSPPRRPCSPRRSSPPRLQPSSVPRRTPPPWRLRAALCHRNPSREGTKPVAWSTPIRSASTIASSPP